MQRFFQSLDDIEQFVASLNSHHCYKCHHCSEQGHFISHGFVYKQYSSANKQAVGKRIVCSNRYGHLGCGKTYQLMLSEQLPSKRYTVTQLNVFILLLLSHLSVCCAYQQATGQDSTRHAWRWLKQLKSKLMDYRGYIVKLGLFEPDKEMPLLLIKTKRRAHPVFDTLAQLFSAKQFTSCADFQIQQQLAFI